MLGLYDENIFYHWTPREWLNRLQGARLAEIDRHELAIHAAWTSGIVSRVQKPKPASKYYDAKKARNEVLYGKTSEKKKADFTFYNKAMEGLKKFDWATHYVPVDKNKK